MTKVTSIKALLLSTVCAIGGSSALAQDSRDINTVEDEIVIVGSQIKGAGVAEALPVTVMDEGDIDVLGIDSGEELFNSIPSQGATNFTGDSETGGVNGARGDVASINLRSLGTGNTLVLLNGRRLVLHPGTQSENLVPVVTPNLNALPTAGIRRLEVLRDGASAIYGADAVGGVINTVLKDNYEGLQLTAKWGDYDDVKAQGITYDVYGGFDLNDGQTNITLFGSYYDRGGIHAQERFYSENDDRRPLVEGTDFDGDTNFRNLSSNTAWGQFDTTQRVRQNGTSLTSSGGRFHIQPTSFSGCRVDLNSDICIDDSSLSSTQRHNTALFDQMTSDLERYNTFAFINHDLEGGNELYGELSYYGSTSKKEREATAILSSTPITVSADGFWNPFGAVGNVNRLPDLDAPVEGLPITLGGSQARYRLIDAGPRRLEVENSSWRALAGMRGDLTENWTFDTAILHSRAETNDLTRNRASATLFQQALNRTTSDAYNPFNGGDINDINGLDATPNPQSVIDSFLIDVRRDSTTSLTLADFKVSNSNLFSWGAGDIGAAFGIEYRDQDYEDDRDNRLDGTQTFTDSVTGIEYGSDVVGSSATPDTNGERQTISAFGELYVPLVSPDQAIPLFHRVDMQLATRFENASDFGDVWAPKIALSWYPVDWLQLRSAYSEGFRAPNLDQINAEGIQRSNTRADYYRCYAQVLDGTDPNALTSCGETQGVLSIRSGSQDLEAETNETYTYGLVFQPDAFIPGLTITADYYNISQDNVVGIAGDQSQIILDFVRRVNGSSNATVNRAAADPDDIAFFAASGLTPVGAITSVADPYLNLEQRTSEGIDVGIYYDLDDTRFGDFGFKLDATQLLEFDQADSSLVDEVRTEPLADDIVIVGAGSLIGQNGQPEWRGVARMTWRSQSGFGAGVSVNHIGSYFDTSAKQNQTGEFFPVEEWTTGNAYVEYTFKEVAGMEKFRARLGATNITNEDPPLSDETYGYDSAYHSNRGRFVYGQLRATF